MGPSFGCPKGKLGSRGGAEDAERALAWLCIPRASACNLATRRCPETPTRPPGVFCARHQAGAEHYVHLTPWGRPSAARREDGFTRRHGGHGEGAGLVSASPAPPRAIWQRADARKLRRAHQESNVRATRPALSAATRPSPPPTYTHAQGDNARAEPIGGGRPAPVAGRPATSDTPAPPPAPAKADTNPIPSVARDPPRPANTA